MHSRRCRPANRTAAARRAAALRRWRRPQPRARLRSSAAAPWSSRRRPSRPRPQRRHQQVLAPRVELAVLHGTECEQAAVGADQPARWPGTRGSPRGAQPRSVGHVVCEGAEPLAAGRRSSERLLEIAVELRPGPWTNTGPEPSSSANIHALVVSGERLPLRRRLPTLLSLIFASIASWKYTHGRFVHGAVSVCWVRTTPCSSQGRWRATPRLSSRPERPGCSWPCDARRDR